MTVTHVYERQTHGRYGLDMLGCPKYHLRAGVIRDWRRTPSMAEDDLPRRSADGPRAPQVAASPCLMSAADDDSRTRKKKEKNSRKQS